MTVVPIAFTKIEMRREPKNKKKKKKAIVKCVFSQKRRVNSLSLATLSHSNGKLQATIAAITTME
jgi:16S rRNA A1518/A1519 N6-dimethyltransferase RsmA/KsgA/DIM1 with predicted DNA glycosylase/AP lyase activity